MTIVGLVAVASSFEAVFVKESTALATVDMIFGLSVLLGAAWLSLSVAVIWPSVAVGEAWLSVAVGLAASVDGVSDPEGC